jgi:glycosyltransferase involved in cell wall biosynthesis
MKIDFCIPVYNEDEIFSASAEKVWAFLQSSFSDHDWRLVFAVNGSSQKFIDAVKKFTDNNRPGSACLIIEKSGKGGAIKACFDASVADILVYMDIDLAVDLDDIFSLLRPVLDGRADFCFGSRMLPSSVKLRSWRREISLCFDLLFIFTYILDLARATDSSFGREIGFGNQKRPLTGSFAV